MNIENCPTTDAIIREHASWAIQALATLMRWTEASGKELPQTGGGSYTLTPEDWWQLIRSARDQVEHLANVYQGYYVK